MSDAGDVDASSGIETTNEAESAGSRSTLCDGTLSFKVSAGRNPARAANAESTISSIATRPCTKTIHGKIAVEIDDCDVGMRDRLFSRW